MSSLLTRVKLQQIKKAIEEGKPVEEDKEEKKKE